MQLVLFSGIPCVDEELLPVLFEILAGEAALVNNFHLLHDGALPRLARACAVAIGQSAVWFLQIQFSCGNHMKSFSILVYLLSTVCVFERKE
jgi:hypothetical protein